MSARDLVGVLVARWWVVALVSAVAFGGVVGGFVVREDSYAARASVLVRSEEPRLDIRLAYYSQELVAGSYNPYADYFAVRARRGGLLDRSVPSGELRTTTTVGNDEIVVELVGLSGTPRGAADLVGSAAEDFVAWVSAGDQGPRSEAPVVRARIAESPRPPGTPADPSTAVVLLVGVIAAAALGVAGALATEAGASRARRRRFGADSA